MILILILVLVLTQISLKLEKSERHIVSEQDPTEERADQIEHADVEDIER